MINFRFLFNELLLYLSGDEGTRTPGLLRAREALSQLSYIPLLLSYRG